MLDTMSAAWLIGLQGLPGICRDRFSLSPGQLRRQVVSRRGRHGRGGLFRAGGFDTLGLT